MSGKSYLTPVLAAGLFCGAFKAAVAKEAPNGNGEMAIRLIERGDRADLIGIDGGLEQGLAPGMVMSVFRNGQRVGELLLTRVEEQCAVALIADLEPEQALAIGDRATPKLRKFNPF